MELICVRHGRTAWNAERRFQGHADIPLDDEGRAQARALGIYLRGESFDVAVTSDLQRAAATAEAIVDGRELPLERDPELREMRFGVWEGLTWDEIIARTPELDYAYEKSPRFYTPEDGESFDQVGERVSRVLARVTARLRPDGRALLVSHAGVMHSIVRVALGGDQEAKMGLRFVPASIMRVTGDPSAGWQIKTINETPATNGVRP